MASCKNTSQCGTQMLVDYFGVDEKKLQDRNSLMRVLRSALSKGGFRIIREAGSHKFVGGGAGVTGFVLLAQSHVAFHSYPEHRYLALDIFWCGSCNPRIVVEELTRYLGPASVSRRSYKRGWH